MSRMCSLTPLASGAWLGWGGHVCGVVWVELGGFGLLWAVGHGACAARCHWRLRVGGRDGVGWGGWVDREAPGRSAAGQQGSSQRQAVPAAHLTTPPSPVPTSEALHARPHGAVGAAVNQKVVEWVVDASGGASNDVVHRRLGTQDARRG